MKLVFPKVIGQLEPVGTLGTELEFHGSEHIPTEYLLRASFLCQRLRHIIWYQTYSLRHLSFPFLLYSNSSSTSQTNQPSFQVRFLHNSSSSYDTTNKCFSFSEVSDKPVYRLFGFYHLLFNTYVSLGKLKDVKYFNSGSFILHEWGS